MTIARGLFRAPAVRPVGAVHERTAVPTATRPVTGRFDEDEPMALVLVGSAAAGLLHERGQRPVEGERVSGAGRHEEPSPPAGASRSLRWS
ncbi:hypothetical protein B7767_38305 [Streptomyces sp. 13-12-16]|uniref:hypothetical protein n=1 Tax=Streptomyces sp. 13-12-16 TaxID=1570823 RepID=UPI000A1E7CDB|nr:hypothetical protein [Streptomyces sp. 13-12-16]OSP32006.1 hypothetical protein B7767_38305 [Streptomyces sp. 13-12-16]